MTCLLIAEGPLTYRGPNFQARLTNIILRRSVGYRAQSDRGTMAVERLTHSDRRDLRITIAAVSPLFEFNHLQRSLAPLIFGTAGAYVIDKGDDLVRSQCKPRH